MVEGGVVGLCVGGEEELGGVEVQEGDVLVEGGEGCWGEGGGGCRGEAGGEAGGAGEEGGVLAVLEGGWRGGGGG